jgi:putative membrane protein
VRVAVVTVAGQRTAYVLVDGNNMDPGVRDRVLDAVEGVDEVEVMTTDTHVVNTLESVNQVGGAIDVDALSSLVGDLVEEAIADSESVEVGMATERAQVTVFGNDRTETLASHANTAVAMGGALVGAVLVATVAVSVLLFFLA